MSMDLKADVMKVVERAEKYNKCIWNFSKQFDKACAYRFVSGCNKKRFNDLHEFKYCPYCGKEIEVKYVR